MKHNTTAIPAKPIPPASCPLCDESHDEVLALLAGEPNGALRKVPSADLLAEEEHLQRELAEAKSDPEYSADLRTLHRHRLSIIEGELQRRRALEVYNGPKVPSGGRIPQETIRQIKERIDLASLVAEDLGNYLWERWGRVQFACRLHGDGVDRNPSLTVYEEDHHFWCFGCGDGGDCFDWLIKARGMEWREAAEYLAKRVGIDLEEKRAKPLVGSVGV